MSSGGPEVGTVNGALRITDWTAGCAMGQPWSSEPADCEEFGGYALVPVEGCGEGTVIMVNEAAGNAFEPDFPHQRVFAPPMFDTGSIGVFVEGYTVPTGLVSGEMVGAYSC